MLEVRTYPTLAEAAENIDPGSVFMSGGTLVMIRVNYGAHGLKAIIRTTDSTLRRIHDEAGRITLGAFATMSDILAHRDLDFLGPAAMAVGGPGVRNAATVGGNLFAPHPYGDFTVALLALDARVHLSDGSAVPIEDFLRNRSGLVASVSFQRPFGDLFRFRKIGRVKPKGASVMSIAAHLGNSPGYLSNARVAYGAMGSAPMRVRAVERALEGAALNRHGIASAIESATEGLEPPTDELASSWYRREVAPVHLRRLLLGEDR
ncbi:MAG: FAD binding domain-containing protein [Roseovarius sp.]|nr:FAD binding domain-containing protein [Roseovarius sp.]